MQFRHGVEGNAMGRSSAPWATLGSSLLLTVCLAGCSYPLPTGAPVEAPLDAIIADVSYVLEYERPPRAKRRGYASGQRLVGVYVLDRSMNLKRFSTVLSNNRVACGPISDRASEFYFEFHWAPVGVWCIRSKRGRIIWPPRGTWCAGKPIDCSVAEFRKILLKVKGSGEVERVKGTRDLEHEK